MIVQPRIRPDLHVEIVGDDVLLIGEGRYLALNGGGLAAVARLIDGRRSTDDIVECLIDDVPAAHLYHALMRLERGGYIEEATDALPADIAAFWSAMGVDSKAAAARLIATGVSVHAFGHVPLRTLTEQLERLHVRLAPEREAKLWVALVDDYLNDELEGFNRRALGAARPWVMARPKGVFSWMGPLFRPRVTGCWACLSQRLRCHRQVEEFAIQQREGTARRYPVRAALPSTVDAALGMLSTEIAKWIVLGRSAVLEGTVLSLDAMALHVQEHVLVRRPQCPECGHGGTDRSRSPAPVIVRSVTKRFVEDGGHRAVAPVETLRRYGHHASPITGVVDGPFRVTDPDSPVHVYLSGNNLAVRHESLQRLRRNLRSSCCGKGVSDEQARASALCEAIERYSGVFRGDEIRRRATLRQLGEEGIDPRTCMLFSDAQYRDRDWWNAKDRRLDMVPLPFDEEVEIDWTPLWSLSRKEFRYLPTSYCYYSYPSPPDAFFCLPDSNGCAAGNTVEEAILQGFMELVERDSVAIWWYNRLRRPSVDLASFDDDFVTSMVAHYNGVGRELWLLDLTSDLGIPSFIALSRRVDQAVEDIVFAPAAHLDARLALVRALTELNQMLPGAESDAPGSGYKYDDPEAVAWWRTATLANQPHLVPSSSFKPRRLDQYPRADSPDLQDDIAYCRSLVEGKGLEMFVLDQTSPDVGLPVVKVIVPGLRHFWARFAPGRLYDVPVEMGWRANPLREEDLNPIAIFI